MNFPFYIARRYLFAKKSTNAINVISGVAVTGVAVATMALVVTLSVFNGFHDMVATFFTSFDPQLKVVPVEGKDAPSDDPVLTEIRQQPEVDVATESVEEMALAIYEGHQAMVTVKGVDDNFTELTHINEIVSKESAYKGTLAPCFRMLKDKSIQFWVLRNTWIRPEDLHKVSGYFETVKLASRISPTIKDIIKGYCEGEWHGNLLKLFEMDYSILPFVPKIMNDKFPDGWFDQTMHCGHHCDSCGYCRKVFEQVAEKTDFMEKKEG